MSLPTCALDDCQQRPEVYVEMDDWGYPKVRKLCVEHADMARPADGVKVGQKGQSRLEFAKLVIE